MPMLSNEMAMAFHYAIVGIFSSKLIILILIGLWLQAIMEGIRHRRKSQLLQQQIERLDQS